MLRSGILGEKSMAAKRHRRSYKFTDKTQSKRGMLSLALAVVSLAVFVAVVAVSFSAGGNGSMYLGSAGVASMLLGFVALILAILSLREENSYRLFPYLGTVLSFLAAGIWVAMYVAGFLL